MKIDQIPHLQRVGVDVSMEKFDASVRIGNCVHSSVFAMTGAGLDQFRKWLKKLGLDAAHLWMEATGRYFYPLAEWAVEKMGWMVTIINPRSIKHFAYSKLKLNKSDKRDAQVILKFAEAATDEELRFWQPKSRSFKELRDLQLEIAGIKKQIGQERNRLKCGLKSNYTRDVIRTNIKFLEAQKKKLHQQSMKVIKQDPELSEYYGSLRAIKGFGEVTIAFLLGKIDFDLFKKGRQLVKFAGLDALHASSGKSSIQRKGISRAGHADIRSQLYWPAIVAMKHDVKTKEFAQALEKRGFKPKQVICAVMSKLLRASFAVVRDGRKASLEAA